MKLVRDNTGISWGPIHVVPFSCIRVGAEKIDFPGEYERSGFFFRVLEDLGEKGVFSFHLSHADMSLFFASSGVFSQGEILDSDVFFLFPDESLTTPKDWKKIVEETDPRMLFCVGNGDRSLALQRELGGGFLEWDPSLDLTRQRFSEEKTLLYTFPLLSS